MHMRQKQVARRLMLVSTVKRRSGIQSDLSY